MMEGKWPQNHTTKERSNILNLRTAKSKDKSVKHMLQDKVHKEDVQNQPQKLLYKNTYKIFDRYIPFQQKNSIMMMPHDTDFAKLYLISRMIKNLFLQTTEDMISLHDTFLENENRLNNVYELTKCMKDNNKMNISFSTPKNSELSTNINK